MYAAAEYREEFSRRIVTLAKEHHDGWDGGRANARKGLAETINRYARKAKLKVSVSERQIERWERGDFKTPRVDLWFLVDDLYQRYTNTCERLEAKARELNSDTGAGAPENQHADDEGLARGGDGMDRAESPEPVGTHRGRPREGNENVND